MSKNKELENQKKIKDKIEIAHNDVLTAKVALDASQNALIYQKEVFSIAQNKDKEGN